MPFISAVTQFGYQRIIKPLAFRNDPEETHDRFTATGIKLGKSNLAKTLIDKAWAYHDPILTQTIHGSTFPNPIGLSAGFDKNAQLLEILPSIGFGFVEIGSITGEPCEGNPKPRLWRLPQSKSLVVYYGLKNDGAEAISARLRGKSWQIPIGVSVAKTNNVACAQVEAGIADYAKAFRAFTDIGSYITINISCPNTFGGEPFTDPDRLEKLMVTMDAIAYDKPVFIKLSPDLSTEQLDQLLDVVARHRVHGIICTNLTKKRSNPKIKETIVPEVGGLSGKVVEDLANAQLEYIARRTQGKYTLVGVGGVFSAEDAYKKIRLGASLIQLITGMIFEGPQVVGDINRGLARLLKRDGFKNISEAVGADLGHS